MRTDIIILSKTRALVAKALASLASTADKKRIGKVWIGWTGEDKYEPQDIEICGLDVSMLSLPFYNFAQNCNELAEMCSSEALLFMNDDVEIVEGDPVSSLLKVLEDTKVGAAGLKLIYPQDGTCQHGGVFIAVKSDGKFHGVGHILHKQDPSKLTGKCAVAGVTGAFMMVRREDFMKLGGFDEGYKHCFEDVDICIRLACQLGKICIVDCDNWAFHYESATRNQACCQDDIKRLTEAFNSRLHSFAAFHTGGRA